MYWCFTYWSTGYTCLKNNIYRFAHLVCTNKIRVHFPRFKNLPYVSKYMNEVRWLRIETNYLRLQFFMNSVRVLKQRLDHRKNPVAYSLSVSISEKNKPTFSHSLSSFSSLVKAIEQQENARAAWNHRPQLGTKEIIKIFFYGTETSAAFREPATRQLEIFFLFFFPTASADDRLLFY